MEVSEILSKLKLGFTVFMTPFNLGLFLGALDSQTYKFVMIKRKNQVGIQLIEVYDKTIINPEMN